MAEITKVYNIIIQKNAENIQQLTKLKSELTALKQEEKALNDEIKKQGTANETQKTQLAAISVATNKLKTDINSLTKEINYNTSAKNAEKNATRDAISNKKLEIQAIKENEAAIKKAEQAKKADTIASKNAEIAAQREAKERQRQTGYINQLTISISQNIQKRNQMSQAELNNAQIGGKLTAQINKQQQELNKLNSAIGRNQGQVGGYQQAIQNTIGAYNAFMLKAVAVVATVKAVYSALSRTSEEYIEIEKITKKLTFALNGNSEAANRIVESSRKMKENSMFPKEEILKAQLFAIQLGKTEEQTQKMMRAAMGLSMVTGQDLNTSLTQLNMMMNTGVARGLNRYVEGLKEMTDKQRMGGEGLDLIIAKFEKFGTSTMTSISGQMKLADDAIDEAYEKFGSKTSSLMLGLKKTWAQIVAGAGQTIEDISGYFKSAYNQNIELADQFVEDRLANYKRLSGKERSARILYYNQELQDAITHYKNIQDKDFAINAQEVRDYQGKITRYNSLLQAIYKFNDSEYAEINKSNQEKSDAQIEADQKEADELKKQRDLILKLKNELNRLTIENMENGLEKELLLNKLSYSEKLQSIEKDYKGLQQYDELKLQEFRAYFQKEIEIRTKFNTEEEKRTKDENQKKLDEQKKFWDEWNKNEQNNLFNDPALKPNMPIKNVGEGKKTGKVTNYLMETFDLTESAAKDLEETAKAGAIEIAQTIESAVFDVRNTARQREYDAQKQALDDQNSLLTTQLENRNRLGALTEGQYNAEKIRLQDEFNKKKRQLDYENNLKEWNSRRLQMGIDYNIAAVKVLAADAPNWIKLGIDEAILGGSYLALFAALQKNKPVYHSGTTSAGNDLKDDEFYAKLQRGEGIVKQPTMAMDHAIQFYGSPKQLVSYMNGLQPSQTPTRSSNSLSPSTVNNMIDNKISNIDARMSDSELKKAIIRITATDKERW